MMNPYFNQYLPMAMTMQPQFAQMMQGTQADMFHMPAMQSGVMSPLSMALMGMQPQLPMLPDPLPQTFPGPQMPMYAATGPVLPPADSGGAVGGGGGAAASNSYNRKTLEDFFRSGRLAYAPRKLISDPKNRSRIRQMHTEMHGG